jgi:hypothetical protein
MPFEEFKPKGTLKADNREFISISKSHIRFSAAFARKAKITKSHVVKIGVNRADYQIQFSFTKDNTENGLALTQPKDHENFQCAAMGLLNAYEWIKAITTEMVNKNRQFTPRPFGKSWIIDLSPAFDLCEMRIESDKIPYKAKGIYRYIRSKTKEIVYIGKGEILNRLRSPERRDWDFDLIQYSIVEDESEQFKWENYWIEKYRSEHKKIPFYNIISGKKKKK